MWLVLKAVISKMLLAGITEKFIIRMVVMFGDWYVKKTVNTYDDSVWEAYKESLKKVEG